MQSVNKIILVGFVAAHPEVRETTNSEIIASFPLATNRLPKEGKTAPTDYHKIVAWNQIAEICRRHVVKGAALYIEGRVQNRTYQTDSGAKRYVTEIVVESLTVLSPKNDDNTPGIEPKDADGGSPKSASTGHLEKGLEESQPIVSEMLDKAQKTLYNLPPNSILNNCL